jgi:hypothetical protein
VIRLCALFHYLWDHVSEKLMQKISTKQAADDLRCSRRWLWRMASSGMLRRVALVRTDVSEEASASFIRVTRIGGLVTALAATSNLAVYFPYLLVHKQTNSVALSPQANYTDWATATYRRNLVPNFVDRGCRVVRAVDPLRSLISVF